MIVPNIISTARVRASYYKAKALVILYLLLRIRKSNRRLRQHSALLYERMQQLMPPTITGPRQHGCMWRAIP